MGLPALQVERIKNNPRFAARVLEKIQVRAIYLAAEALGPIGEQAKANERAFAVLLRVASGESAGRSVTINNVNAQLGAQIIDTASAVKSDQELLQRGTRLMNRLGLVLIARDEKKMIEEAVVHSTEGGSASAAS